MHTHQMRIKRSVKLRSTEIYLGLVLSSDVFLGKSDEKNEKYAIQFSG